MWSTKSATRWIALLAGCAVAFSRWTPIYDPDCFWHLHTGRYVLAHHAIPWIDTFSHTAAGQPWRFIDVTADVVLYAFYSLGGPTALIACIAALGFLAASLSTLTQARSLGTPSPQSLVAMAPWVVTSLAFRLTPRPQTFTFVGLACVMYVVVASQKKPKLLWWVPVIAWAWQNFHASGPLVVLIAGATAVATMLDARAGAASRPVALTVQVTLASAIALLGCPHPIERLAQGFSHITDSRLATLISEWLPVWDHRVFSSAVVALVVLMILAVIAAVQPREKRPETALLLIAAGVAVMSVRAVRFVPMAALALAPVAVHGVRRLTEVSRAPKLALALTLALFLGGTFSLYSIRKPFGTGVHPAHFPRGAAAFVARTHPQGKLVHDFMMGGYLMYALGEQHPVFVDGRSWALYDVNFLVDALQLTYETLARLIDRYDLRLAILNTDARVPRLQTSGWHLVYLDDTASVLVRAPADDAYVQHYGYHELHPGRWAEDMVRWSRDSNALQRADVESARITAEAPTSAMAWVLRASVLTAASRDGAANEATQTALRLRPDMTPPHRLAMLRCAASNNRSCVCSESAAVRSRAPQNQQAREYAQRFGCDH
jgi:hypothetical protein